MISVSRSLARGSKYDALHKRRLQLTQMAIFEELKYQGVFVLVVVQEGYEA